MWCVILNRDAYDAYFICERRLVAQRYGELWTLDSFGGLDPRSLVEELLLLTEASQFGGRCRWYIRFASRPRCGRCGVHLQGGQPKGPVHDLSRAPGKFGLQVWNAGCRL